MANDNLEIFSKQYNTLTNSKGGRLSVRRDALIRDNNFTELSKVALNHDKPDYISGRTFQAIVLRVYDKSENKVPGTSIFGLLKNIIGGAKNPSENVQQVRAVVTDVHSLIIPLPKDLSPETLSKPGEVQKYVELAPTFYGIGITDTIAVGAIIEVVFDDNSYSEGKILKVISSTSIFGAGSTSPASAFGNSNSGIGRLGCVSRVSSPFSPSRVPPVGGGAPRPHNGTDVAAPVGSGIRAAMPGTVIFSGFTPGEFKKMGARGNNIIIQHAGNIITQYFHCDTLIAKKGAEVIAGQQIATVGSTGASTGPHLHIEVRINEVPTDPVPFLDNLNKSSPDTRTIENVVGPFRSFSEEAAFLANANKDVVTDTSLFLAATSSTNNLALSVSPYSDSDCPETTYHEPGEA